MAALVGDNGIIAQAMKAKSGAEESGAKELLEYPVQYCGAARRFAIEPRYPVELQFTSIPGST